MPEEVKERTPPPTIAADDSEEQKKQSVYFTAIVQADYAAQMDVYRWLLQDRSYIVVAILHDRDKYTEEEINKKGKNGVYTHKNGDGTESQFRAGDIKPPHYHIMVKTPHKTTAKTFSKRFCNQVNFLRQSDRYYYAAYLLHETFDSRYKAHYDESELIFSDVTTAASVNYYRECRDDNESQLLNALEAARKIARTPGKDRKWGMSPQEFFEIALDSGDAFLIKSMMSHAYFYKTFVLGDSEDSDKRG